MKGKFLPSWSNSQEKHLHKFLLFTLVIIIGYFIYAPLFSAPFYQDDTLIILENTWIRHIPPGTWYAHPFSDSSQVGAVYRPTLVMSYWINQLLIPGPLEFSLRLGSLMLLFLNGILLAKISSFFLPEDKTSPWLIGLLYILHPVQTLAVVYLWKRSTLLCTFFILLGLYSFFQKIQRASKIDLKFILFQMFCFAGAITSKEEGIIYPVILSICSIIFFYREAFSKANSKYALILFQLCMFGLLDFLVQTYTGSHLWKIIFNPDRIEYFKQSLTVLTMYFKNMVLPSPLLFAEPAKVTEWLNVYSSFTIIFFIVSLFLMFRSSTSKFIKLALVFVWIGFLPNSSFQPLLVQMDQIRMHLPLAGFSILLILLLRRIPSKKIFHTVVGCICVVFSIQSFLQSVRYLQPVLIWKDIVTQYPKSKLAWDQLGTSFEIKRDYPNAARAFQISYDIDRSATDELVRALINRYRSGESKELIEKEYRKIDLSIPHSKYIDFQIALLQLELGLLDESETTLREFLKYYPNYAQAHFALGLVFEQKHFKDLSKQAFQNALLLNPNHTQAKEGLKRLSE